MAVERVKRLLEPDDRLAEIQGLWATVVGVGVAEKCKPEKENEGVVVVGCSSSVWAQEMSAMEDQVRRALNDGLGDGWVRELRFRVVGL